MSKILIIEDEAAIRRVLTKIISEENDAYKLEEAEDGLRGIELIKDNDYDLVLCDIKMPKMDGITLVRELRGLANYKFTPILLLTTEAGADKKKEGKDAGATGWLVKPFNPDQLLSTIKKVIG